jgi:hypothetical protein
MSRRVDMRPMTTFGRTWGVNSKKCGLRGIRSRDNITLAGGLPLRYTLFLVAGMECFYLYLTWYIWIQHKAVAHTIDIRPCIITSIAGTTIVIHSVATTASPAASAATSVRPPSPPPTPCARPSVAAYLAGRLRQVCNSISPSPYRRGSRYVFYLF